MPRIGFARCQFQLIYIRYIFAYLGPHPAPRLPRWGLLAEVGLPRDIVTIDVPCNWLQIMENSIDRLHFEWLHVRFHNFALAQSGQEPRPDTSRDMASQRLPGA